MITDAKEKAAIFNEYFISQCKVENNNAPVPILNEFQTSKILSHLSTTENEVKDLLSTVDVSKGCGVDGVIKTCAVGIATSFSRFINISFSNGNFRLVGNWQMLYQFLKKIIANRKRIIVPFLYYRLCRKFARK